MDVASGDKARGEELAFLSDVHPIVENALCEKSFVSTRLLTKDELRKIDDAEPIWRRLRLSLIIIFWLIWIILLIISIIVIVFSKQCPEQPVLNFWQTKTGYWLNVFSFKDSDGDMVGDLQGLIDSVDYIENTVGAGFLILSPFLPMQQMSLLPGKVDFMTFDSRLGSLESIRSMLRFFKKRGIEVVLSFDFNLIPSYNVLDTMENLISQSESKTGTLALSVSTPSEMKHIEETIQFWFMQGFDGIMLLDTLYYADSSKKFKHTSTNNSCQPIQLNVSKSVDVVIQIRKLIDEVSKSSRRKRVLIIDPGNLGDVDNDHLKNSKLFFGNEDSPGADLIISRRFLNRSMCTNISFNSSLRYSRYILGEKGYNFAYPTATPVNAHQNQIHYFTMSILASASPILYYGTELFSLNTTENEYSEGLVNATLPLGYSFENYPMPWDNSGIVFSENASFNTRYKKFITDFKVDDTVASVLAAGRGYSLFNFTIDLIRLRKSEPSLLWGNISQVNYIQGIPDNANIFKRQAKGFPTVLFVLFPEHVESVINFNDECDQPTLLLRYPPSILLPLNEPLKTTIYFPNLMEKSVYVFRCTA